MKGSCLLFSEMPLLIEQWHLLQQAESRILPVKNLLKRKAHERTSKLLWYHYIAASVTWNNQFTGGEESGIFYSGSASGTQSDH